MTSWPGATGGKANVAAWLEVPGAERDGMARPGKGCVSFKPPVWGLRRCQCDTQDK